MAVMEEGREELQAIRYRRGHLELLDQVGFQLRCCCWVFWGSWLHWFLVFGVCEFLGVSGVYGGFMGCACWWIGLLQFCEGYESESSARGVGRNAKCLCWRL